jgi:uncharacterized protein (DUF934 family)
MSEPKPLLAPLRPASTTPRLWNGDRFVVDAWVGIADDAPIPLTGHAIISLPRWRAEQVALTAQGQAIGVRVEPSEPIDPATDHLDRLGVIALAFPKFSDGRAYTTARRLREQWDYRGEIRATGDVLLDQLPLMLRSGFDAFEIVNAATIAALEAAPVPAVPYVYQRSVGGNVSGWRERRSAAPRRAVAE